MPDWLFPFAVGVALASYVWDPFQSDSRLRQLWHWATDHFKVELLFINEPLSVDGNLLRAEAHLRLRKPTKGRLWLRTLNCAGMQREPGEKVIDLGEIDLPKGGQKTVILAELAIPYPGWTPPGLAGLIANSRTLIAGSQNIMQIELTGVWPKQVYRCMVARLDFHGRETRPALFAASEEDDIFDAFRNVRK